MPIRLLHEGEGHTVAVELRNGEVYRGTLKEAEDTMNCYLSNVTMTARDGRVSKLEQVAGTPPPLGRPSSNCPPVARTART